MAFSNRHYPEAVRQQLVEARYQALKQLVELANEARCQLFLVAGDLFHRARMPREAIARVVQLPLPFPG